MTLGSENFQIQYVDATNPAAVFVYSTSTYPKVTHTTPSRSLIHRACAWSGDFSCRQSLPARLRHWHGHRETSSRTPAAVANGICGWVNVAAGTPEPGRLFHAPITVEYWSRRKIANRKLGGGQIRGRRYRRVGQRCLPGPALSRDRCKRCSQRETVSGTGATLCTDSERRPHDFWLALQVHRFQSGNSGKRCRLRSRRGYNRSALTNFQYHL